MHYHERIALKKDLKVSMQMIKSASHADPNVLVNPEVTSISQGFLGHLGVLQAILWLGVTGWLSWLPATVLQARPIMLGLYLEQPGFQVQALDSHQNKRSYHKTLPFQNGFIWRSQGLSLSFSQSHLKRHTRASDQDYQLQYVTDSWGIQLGHSRFSGFLQEPSRAFAQISSINTISRSDQPLVPLQTEKSTLDLLLALRSRSFSIPNFFSPFAEAPRSGFSPLIGINLAVEKMSGPVWSAPLNDRSDLLSSYALATSLGLAAGVFWDPVYIAAYGFGSAGIAASRAAKEATIDNRAEAGPYTIQPAYQQEIAAKAGIKGRDCVGGLYLNHHQSQMTFEDKSIKVIKTVYGIYLGLIF